MSKQISKEDYEKLRRVQKEANSSISQLVDECDPDDDCEVLDAMGEGYELGNVILQPLTPALMPLLEMIGSPFLSANKGDEISFDAVVQTLYVIGARELAVAPLMGLKRRESAIKKCEELAKESPEHFQIYLDKLDSLNEKWAEFENNAIAFYDQMGSPCLAEVGEVIVQMIKGAFGGFSLLPDDGKKN